MKKILTGLLVCFLTVFMTVSSASALDVNKVKEAYEKVIEYYEKHKVLESPDEIIAVEALGLEAEDGFQLPDLESIDFESSTIGDLTKSIVALVLIGKDPTDINGQNLVEILEGYVQKDGSVKSGSYEADAGYLVWVYYALETVGSEKADKVANYLATTDNSNVNFGDGGFTSYGSSSLDVTGWCIEALSLSGKYSSRIESAKEYLNNHLVDSAYIGFSGANADTQACVLQGLYIDALMNGQSLDKFNNELEVLLSFQLTNEEDAGHAGAFKSSIWEYDPDTGNYNETDVYEFNAYATMEAARCLGTYMNGSFVLKAKDAYEKLKVEEPTKEPEEEKPTVDVEKDDTIKKPETNQNSQTTTTTSNKPVTTTENAKVVETSDTNDVNGFIAMAIISGGLFIILRRKNEDIC